MTPAATPTDPVRHLVRRATWGPTPTLLAEVAARGRSGWLADQLDPASVPDPDCDALMTRFTKLHRTIAQVRAQDSNGSWDTMQQLAFATLARYTWSRRQLFEVMCDFWSNHLNVTCPSSDVWADRHDYDASVIRAHALGSFTDLLIASARHPSMLRYLDGASSTKAAPNQNHGRELMELHTVGIDAGYGEGGVVAAAQVLTGSTITAAGDYAFDPRRHDPSAAKVLGWTTPAHDASTGEAVQTSLLRYLATHPATATHLATKLCLRFVSDTPPTSLVSSLAKTYLSSGTQVVPVLKALFASAEFAASAGAKTRRPLEGLVATVRAIGAGPGTSGLGGADELYWMVSNLGHAPLAWGPPNGYPDTADAWVSAGATIRRWNHSAELVNHWSPKDLAYSPAATAPPSPLPATYGALISAVVARALYRPATALETSALLAYCGKSASTPVNPKDEWVTWHFGALVSLVLDAPGHMER